VLDDAVQRTSTRTLSVAARTIALVATATGDAGSRVYPMAPWARRRGLLVQAALAVGGVVLGAAIVAMLSGTEGFAVGVGLAIVMAALGFGGAVFVRWMIRRVRLVVDDGGVTYDAGTHRIEARWSDVAAVDLIIRGADTGPALVLSGDRAVSGGGMLATADIAGAIDGAGIRPPSLRSTIPLNAFIQGPLQGSPLEADLRTHIPAQLDAYLARHGDGGRA
jgi:hypothetical protein